MLRSLATVQNKRPVGIEPTGRLLSTAHSPALTDRSETRGDQLHPAPRRQCLSPNPKPITRRIRQVQPPAQVPLGRRDRRVPQGDLDLLDRRAALPGQLGEGPSEVCLLYTSRCV